MLFRSDGKMTDYLAFSPEYIYGAASNLRYNIGTIVSLALYTFLLVLCVVVMIDVINRLL